MRNVKILLQREKSGIILSFLIKIFLLIVFAKRNIKIINLLGELIQQQTNNTKQVTIDMSSYAKVVYFIKVMDEKGNVADRKIILQ